ADGGRSRRGGEPARGRGAALAGHLPRRRGRPARSRAERGSPGGSTIMTEPQLALPDRVGVVNVGLSLFADAIREQGAPVISVDWRVPAGGQPDAGAALGRLYGVHPQRIEAAHAEGLPRPDGGAPLLPRATTGAAPAPALF